MFFERQKREHGPKGRGQGRPLEGSSGHPIRKQEVLKSEKEKGKKSISKRRAGIKGAGEWPEELREDEGAGKDHTGHETKCWYKDEKHFNE